MAADILVYKSNLVPVGDEKSMASAIFKVLNDPVLAEQLSTAGRERAKFFSVAKNVGEYEKVFDELSHD